MANPCRLSCDKVGRTFHRLRMRASLLTGGVWHPLLVPRPSLHGRRIGVRDTSGPKGKAGRQKRSGARLKAATSRPGHVLRKSARGKRLERTPLVRYVSPQKVGMPGLSPERARRGQRGAAKDQQLVRRRKEAVFDALRSDQRHGASRTRTASRQTDSLRSGATKDGAQAVCATERGGAVGK